jgi:LPXTG-motif cell wall-anchored protein
MKKFFSFLLALGLFICTGVPRAEAKLFANNFIEFQLPEKWECKLDGSEWVCQSVDEQKKRDAIIVLAAKIKKEGMDELPIYREHLEKKQVYPAPNGQKVVSEPRYVKELQISNKVWIDSLHLQSEIPDFFTRYLATIEADLGILVTFSVRKDKYTEYAKDIEEMVKSLRAFRKPGPINTTTEDLAPTGADEDKEVISGGFLPEKKCPAGEGYNEKTGLCQKLKKKDTGQDDMMAMLALFAVLAGAVGFIIWKKKKQG